MKYVSLAVLLAGCMGSAGRPLGGPIGAPRTAGVAPADPHCIPSALYGRQGERWKATGRLIDVSFAGYRTGIQPIPDVPGPVRRVTEFGARGDDEIDDTEASLSGIAATEGVLLIPAGRYVISQRLEIRKSQFDLRGEGRKRPRCFFPSRSARSMAATFSSAAGSSASVVRTRETRGPEGSRRRRNLHLSVK